MLDFLKNFLRKLQNADEDRKTKWVVVGTAAITFLVVFVWLKYFNSLIAPNRENDSRSPAAAFWETFKNGANVIYSEVGNGISELKDKIGGPTEYDIRPQR